MGVRLTGERGYLALLERHAAGQSGETRYSARCSA